MTVSLPPGGSGARRSSPSSFLLLPSPLRILLPLPLLLLLLVTFSTWSTAVLCYGDDHSIDGSNGGSGGDGVQEPMNLDVPFGHAGSRTTAFLQHRERQRRLHAHDMADMLAPELGDAVHAFPSGDPSAQQIFSDHMRAAVPEMATPTPQQPSSVNGIEVDPRGYLLYCGCMGRFGNQAEHFLGTLAFAKKVDRTLVLPPFIDYGKTTSFVPFTNLFDVSTLAEYHRVMPMDTFMSMLAPTLWPPSKRVIYCHHRGDPSTVQCNAKQGNPFGPFWEQFGIEFTSDHAMSTTWEWSTRLSPEEHFVIALKGAPATYPMHPRHRPLAKYISWNADYTARGAAWIKKHLVLPFAGVHLRVGSDWERACSGGVGRKSYMASPQCSFNGLITQDMCYPDKGKIIQEISALAVDQALNSVFIATDVPAFGRAVKAELEQLLGIPVALGDQGPYLDLVVMTQSDVFLGNCISSFTSFVARYHLAKGRTPHFFGLTDLH